MLYTSVLPGAASRTALGGATSPSPAERQPLGRPRAKLLQGAAWERLRPRLPDPGTGSRRLRADPKLAQDLGERLDDAARTRRTCRAMPPSTIENARRGVTA